MKLKERAPAAPPEFVSPWRDFISPPPIFDMEKARRAIEAVEEMGIGQFQALRLTLILAVYNLDVSTSASQADIKKFLKRYTLLASGEVAASDPANPLPTIGFEVESPRKPFDAKTDGLNYSRFFDLIGMPRNKVNRSAYSPGSDWLAFWEFSPPPSYSAAVGARILSELIKGRFIPSLLVGQEAGEIVKHLDDKLVSFHINLGIPRDIENSPLGRIGEDAEIFSSAFALAFTSGVRLRHRAQDGFVKIKSDEVVKDLTKVARSRLEMKPFEVRTAQTYRLMSEIQLLGAAFFGYFADRPVSSGLGKIWIGVKNEVLAVFADFQIKPEILVYKPRFPELLEEGDISQKLRHIIRKGAIDVSRSIKLDTSAV